MRLSQAGKAPAEADLVFQEGAQSCDDFARLADLAWPHHHTLDEAKDKRVWQGDSDKAPPSFCKSFEELACEEDAALKNLLLASEENRDDPDRKFQRGEISYSELQEAVFGTKSLEATVQGISKSEYQNPELLRFPNAKKI